MKFFNQSIVHANLLIDPLLLKILLSYNLKNLYYLKKIVYVNSTVNQWQIFAKNADMIYLSAIVRYLKRKPGRVPPPEGIQVKDNFSSKSPILRGFPQLTACPFDFFHGDP